MRSAVGRGATLLHGASILDETNDGGTDAGFLFPAAVTEEILGPVVTVLEGPTAGLDLNVPFGGVKDSSTNTFREQGKSALDFFTWGKTVYTGV